MKRLLEMDQARFYFCQDPPEHTVLHNIDYDPEDMLKPHDPQAEREEAALTRLSRKPKRKIRKPKE